MEIDEYVGMGEAVELTGYRRQHIASLCASGKLPGAKKVGRNWLIPRTALAEYTPGPQGFAAHPENIPRRKRGTRDAEIRHQPC